MRRVLSACALVAVLSAAGGAWAKSLDNHQADPPTPDQVVGMQADLARWLGAMPISKRLTTSVMTRWRSASADRSNVYRFGSPDGGGITMTLFDRPGRTLQKETTVQVIAPNSATPRGRITISTVTYDVARPGRKYAYATVKPLRTRVAHR
ncbi:MAG: hypothetical protein IT371_04645 [Deltaproteobacteria bacterium]|nr:hypothetical protein [Deltaproteobacteria bacterium]